MILVSGANRHDSKMFERCVDAIPAIAGLSGRPRKRPAKLHADKGYDFKAMPNPPEAAGHHRPDCQTRR